MSTALDSVALPYNAAHCDAEASDLILAGDYEVARIILTLRNVLCALGDKSLSLTPRVTATALREAAEEWDSNNLPELAALARARAVIMTGTEEQ